MNARLIALATAAVLVPAPAAGASTVTLTPERGALALAFTAEQGERNSVELRLVLDQLPVRAELTDSGSEVAAGTGCTTVDAHTVHCPAPELAFIERARFHLGDEDDRLVVRRRGSIPVQARGGAGDDALLGGTASDALRGGPGRDVLRGREGDDTLTGDEADARPEADRIAGGLGRGDVVDYSSRTSAVDVDLTRRDGNGAPGEGDAVTGVEDVVGGFGDDRLAGDDRANVLTGGAGVDRLIGRAGNDTLTRGGAMTSCGNGDDLVTSFVPPARAPRVELVGRDCERVRRSDAFQTYPAHPAIVRPRWIGWRAPCARRGRRRCALRMRIVEASGARRLLARGRREADAAGRMVRLRLTPLGRRILSDGSGTRVTVIAGKDLRWTINLRA